MSGKVSPPRGFRFNPFADAMRGVSLFQMEPEDWLEPILDDDKLEEKS